MCHGKLDRSILLPPGLIEPHHAPDGLAESDIDLLIAGIQAGVKPSQPYPGGLSTDPISTRRARRTARRALPAVGGHDLVSRGCGRGMSTVTWALPHDAGDISGSCERKAA